MMNEKQSAAEKAAEAIQNGMIVGLGTGSTASFAIEALGARVKRGLQIKAVASSLASERRAQELGIAMAAFNQFTKIDVTIDGADEVDRQHNLIKGGGGALLREKILAYNSKLFMVVVDESKLVSSLGRFPLPVEIVPFAAELTQHQLSSLGCGVTIRQRQGKPFITENGNLIADCSFNQIGDPEKLNNLIQLIPGVVDCGLFLHDKVSKVIVGYKNGSVQELA